MAIAVDWPTKVITVNQTDPEVSLVAGKTYELDTNAFRLALKALEDDEAGIPYPRIVRHSTIVTIDGVQYVRSWEIINGYTISCLPDDPITGNEWRLRMDGASNNNFHSEGILLQNHVQVIPANSAGNTIVATGISGLTGSESAALISTAADAAASAADALLARKLLDADETLAANGTWILTDSDDGVTVLRTRQVTDKSGSAITLPDGAIARRTRV